MARTPNFANYHELFVKVLIFMYFNFSSLFFWTLHIFKITSRIVICITNYANLPKSILPYLLHACDFRYLNDLFVLDLKTSQNLQWEVPTQLGSIPTPRESHTCVSYTKSDGKNQLLVFGGMSGCRLGDLYQLDIGKK